ncbi:Cof-type HAD-IIB family hydrolase [Salipaludibacillus aurantiacus]|uniref:Cof subfamily of IIB subfamily of haloacid dehalogenase superfamily/HAD-superfamily hydrolase, subfamily IIB n=1 Tax=Salipaludibacillus aurantiacus TaxID=1601833 RepID=A0A1H9X224_9BACI|nr:Cof-type HAD-IIB family hydrolase [Salipaludibacillus aurantiacus]SES40190.1 hypothetical protein SAMN05518684_12320 [Salipaludibacillus aurantiacus]
MGQKLIFFDIDGTLLDHDKALPATTEQAVKQLKNEGHYVAIATGRAPFMYKRLREKLGIYTFISFNGQYVALEGDPIVRNPLNKKELARFTEAAVESDHPVVYMDHEDMKANIPYHPHIETSIGSLKFEHPAYDPAYLEEREIYQALLFCTADEQQPYEERFEAFDFIRWHEFSTDVLPSGGSKAKGIEAVMNRLNMKREDVYVFGDGPNDLEMLQFTDNSVAMGNALPEVKKAAGFVTKDVDDDGIVHGLKHMGLL